MALPSLLDNVSKFNSTSLGADMMFTILGGLYNHNDNELKISSNMTSDIQKCDRITGICK